ncbi:polygalacturonase-like [Rhynchophorus ferrugineus]|uniref:polygalacturonase-like n=1 Tax=Rhynchophorus ferrugineus TaxID=354439 RepID=UPI003FCE5FDB
MCKYVLQLVLVVGIALAVRASPLNASCSVSSYDDVASAVSSCTSITLGSFTVPAGKALSMSLKSGTTVTVTGTIKFAYSEWKGPLVEISGSKITFKNSGGTFDGQGANYWDGKGDSGVTKPKFFRIKTSGGSTFTDIKLKNCPHQCVSINSASDTTLNGWTIDVSAGDSGGGKNTDGFDLSSSSGITIENSVVKNQDDCVAINQGYNYVFKNLTCSGGHGLSLSVGQSSSSGSENTVSNVTFSDCTVKNSRNGIHVKTHSDAGTGSVTDVTYKNIKLSGITNYGINVQQDYENGSSSGNPKGNIPIKNLKLSSVTGSMSGGSSSMPVYILCGSGGCSSWTWSGVSITGGKKSNSCNFSPSGFTC